jgi:hypothetical protein
MGSALDIVDAQVHLFTEDAAPYPWDQALYADPALAGMIARFQARAAHGSIEAMLACGAGRWRAERLAALVPAVEGRQLAPARRTTRTAASSS